MKNITSQNNALHVNKSTYESYDTREKKHILNIIHKKNKISETQHVKCLKTDCESVMCLSHVFKHIKRDFSLFEYSSIQMFIKILHWEEFML